MEHDSPDLAPEHPVRGTTPSPSRMDGIMAAARRLPGFAPGGAGSDPVEATLHGRTGLSRLGSPRPAPADGTGLPRSRATAKDCTGLHVLGFNTRIHAMDKAISATDANQRFSELLREVAEGHSYTVMSRGRAVARVLPVDREQERRAVSRLLHFVRQLPVRHAGNWSRDDLYE